MPFCHRLTVTHGGIDLFSSPHSYVRLKEYFIVNNLFLCDTEGSDGPFKSIHLIKKAHLQTQSKIVGTGVTLDVTNTCGVGSEDFMINVLNTFDLDIVKSALILKDRTPQYIEKYTWGQIYLR